MSRRSDQERDLASDDDYDGESDYDQRLNYCPDCGRGGGYHEKGCPGSDTR